MNFTTLLVPTADFPNITPNFDAPFFKGLTMIASWFLAAALVIAFIVLVVSILLLVLKGVASAQMRALAGAALPYAILGLIVLSGITGLFAWLIGLDFGFGTSF